LKNFSIFPRIFYLSNPSLPHLSPPNSQRKPKACLCFEGRGRKGLGGEGQGERRESLPLV